MALTVGQLRKILNNTEIDDDTKINVYESEDSGVTQDAFVRLEWWSEGEKPQITFYA